MSGVLSISVGRARVGPLASYVDEFAADLRGKGYCSCAMYARLGAVVGMSRWLERRGLTAADLTRERIARFVAAGAPRCASRALLDLMQWLRRDGVLPATDPPAADRVGRAMAPFEEYLVHERGIATTTLEYHYRRVIRPFLAWRFRRGPVVLGEIRARDVTRFQLRLARDEGRECARRAVYTLRVFLRYLRMRGHVDADLAACVLPVAHWRLATIPSWIEARDVRRILVHCDRRDAKGLRDYAILVVIARLGLRAGEVVGLRLDDLRWESGEIVVRGSKCRRLDRLPLPHDVGAALAAYLRRGRPRSAAREVFVRMYAPRRALTTGGLTVMVRRAIDRAGLDPPHKGPHMLRHSLATHMLAKGASLAEVGEVLRHADAETTAIYAKVDLKSLRSVAQRWPGGGR